MPAARPCASAPQCPRRAHLAWAPWWTAAAAVECVPPSSTRTAVSCIPATTTRAWSVTTATMPPAPGACAEVRTKGGYKVVLSIDSWKVECWIVTMFRLSCSGGDPFFVCNLWTCNPTAPGFYTQLTVQRGWVAFLVFSPFSLVFICLNIKPSSFCPSCLLSLWGFRANS